MKDFSKRYPDRQFDVMFYADDELLSVYEVQAFICAENTMRWVPEAGYSVDIGSRVFRSQADALSALRRMAKKELPEAEKRVSDLRALLV